MQFNGSDKKESRKMVVTKICFYGKQNEKMKVAATIIHPDGSDKKGIRKKGYH